MGNVRWVDGLGEGDRVKGLHGNRPTPYLITNVDANHLCDSEVEYMELFYCVWRGDDVGMGKWEFCMYKEEGRGVEDG